MEETRFFCPNCGTELKEGNYYFDEHTNLIHVEKCPNCGSESSGDIARTSDYIDDIVNKVIGVNVFKNGSVEYDELSYLDNDAWDYLIDKLASFGYIIRYNNAEDKFVIS